MEWKKKLDGKMLSLYEENKEGIWILIGCVVAVVKIKRGKRSFFIGVINRRCQNQREQMVLVGPTEQDNNEKQFMISAHTAPCLC